jgi:hypothetical protein
MTDGPSEPAVASDPTAAGEVPAPGEQPRRAGAETAGAERQQRSRRTRRATTATQDAPAEEVAEAGDARSAGDAVEALGRRIGADAVSLVQQEIAHSGLGERLQLAGAGMRQVTVGATLGVCAVGAAAAGVVLLWRRVLPPWLAAFAAAGTFGAAAAPLVYVGAQQLKQGVTPPAPG